MSQRHLFFRRNRTGFDESFSKSTFMITMTNFEKDIFESGNLQRDRNYEMIITFQKIERNTFCRNI